MNEESRPPQGGSPTRVVGKANTYPTSALSAWAREVRTLSDEDLMLVVRAQVAVDRAVNTYRNAAAAPYSFNVPT